MAFRPTTRASVAAIAVLALGIAAATTTNRTGESRPERPLALKPIVSTASDGSITVRAVGRVETAPDTLTVMIGVQSRAATARAALDRNNDRARKVIELIKAAGVPAKDVQTSQLSIYPSYDDHNEVIGYQASNTVSAKLHDLTKAGPVIDAAATESGDDIRLDGISFSVEDTTAALSAARKNAIEQANIRAKEYAKAAGAELGAVRVIDEEVTPMPPIFSMESVARTADVAGGAVASVPVEPGQHVLEVRVKVVYRLG